MDRVVLVGDRDADPLVRPLEAELRRHGHPHLTLTPAALSGARIAFDADGCTFQGQRVGSVVFRASPTLLVAPDFADDEAAFASSEFRAAWAHVLALPGIIAVNRAHPDAWFSSSERAAWLRRLAGHGVVLAPRRIGRPYPGGRWILWTGGMRALPAEGVCERMGIASIPSGALVRTLCCAGAVLDANAADAHLDRIARACLDAGLVLASITVDTAGRLVDVEPVPPIPAARAGAIAKQLGAWIDAAVRRRS